MSKVRELSDFIKCKLCGCEIDKYDLIQLNGHMLAVIISQKLPQGVNLSEVLNYFVLR